MSLTSFSGGIELCVSWVVWKTCNCDVYPVPRTVLFCCYDGVGPVVDLIVDHWRDVLVVSRMKTFDWKVACIESCTTLGWQLYLASSVIVHEDCPSVHLIVFPVRKETWDKTSSALSWSDVFIVLLCAVLVGVQHCFQPWPVLYGCVKCVRWSEGKLFYHHIAACHQTDSGTLPLCISKSSWRDTIKNTVCHRTVSFIVECPSLAKIISCCLWWL